MSPLAKACYAVIGGSLPLVLASGCWPKEQIDEDGQGGGGDVTPPRRRRPNRNGAEFKLHFRRVLEERKIRFEMD